MICKVRQDLSEQSDSTMNSTGQGPLRESFASSYSRRYQEEEPETSRRIMKGKK